MSTAVITDRKVRHSSGKGAEWYSSRPGTPMLTIWIRYRPGDCERGLRESSIVDSQFLCFEFSNIATEEGENVRSLICQLLRLCLVGIKSHTQGWVKERLRAVLLQILALREVLDRMLPCCCQECCYSRRWSCCRQKVSVLDVLNSSL